MSSVQHLIKYANLPTLPQAIWEIRRLIDEDGDLNQIADLIAQDAGLAALTLKTANCGLYGKNETLFEAIKSIGLNQIENMVLVSGVFMALKSADSKTFDLETFWLKSSRMAFLANMVSQRLDINRPNLVHTCALLSHIGEAILDMGLIDLRKLRQALKHNKLPVEKAQTEVLGYNHIDITVALFNDWNLPNTLVDPIRLFTTEQAITDDICCILQIANFYLSDMFGQYAEIDDAILQKYHWDEDSVESIRNELIPLYDTMAFQENNAQTSSHQKHSSGGKSKRSYH
ncbi:MAG: HDOD domain-containing protein [Gammaproteobacteria bacterium]